MTLHRLFHVNQEQAPIRRREELRPINQRAFLAVEDLPHGEITNAQRALHGDRNIPRVRENRVHNEKGRVCRHSGRYVGQDLDGVGVRPVVQDHAQQIHPCAADRLCVEEVVAPEADALRDRWRLLPQELRAVLHDVVEVLDLVAERGVRLGQREGAVACRAPDLEQIYN